MKEPAAQRSIVVSDCTLREGEQQPGIVLDRAAKVRIAERLADVGITRAELGTPAVSPDERASVAEIVRLGLIPESIVVCRTMKQDIELAADCGVWGVVISSPVSPMQLEHKLHRPLAALVEGALEVHAYARELGLRTFASAYDTLRTPWRSLKAIYGAMAESGLPEGVRVVDTVGVGTPDRVGRLVARISAAFGLPIEVHFHDDLGLAMANAVTAVKAGADSVSSSVAGVGERAGNVPTEEILIALEVGYGIDTGCHLDELGPALRDIVAAMELPMSPNKAIVGDNAFRHVAGLSVSGFLRDPLVAQPFAAELVGLTSTVELGKTSGRDGLAYRLRTLGIDSDSVDIPSLLAAVKRRSEERRSLITDDELRRLLDDEAYQATKENE
jgi:isopropylmalate/homocitrate/citramalate synthase